MTNAKFREHVKGKNAQWWLELFAISVEETGDWDAAARVADEMYSDMPEPPAEDLEQLRRQEEPVRYARPEVELLAAAIGAQALGDYLILPTGDGARRVRVVTVDNEDRIEPPEDAREVVVIHDGEQRIYYHAGSGGFELPDAQAVSGPDELRGLLTKTGSSGSSETG